MTDAANALYHIGHQEARVLLAPIDTTLLELERRLGHYATRLRMSDDDRATMHRAAEIVAQARRDIGGLEFGAGDSEIPRGV